jgi:flagellar assembly protein FliH
MSPTSFEQTSKKRESHSEPFHYAAVLENPAESERSGPLSPQNGGNKAEAERREREAYEKGAREGEARATAAYRAEISGARANVSKLLEDFKAERDSYFRRIEPEIVQLALAIARKILHREAQMDPLLLTGMVHVALEKLDSGARVRMRVNPGDVHSWNEYFSQSSEFPQPPELVGDAALQHGECAMETEIGSTTISLDTQLKEIEQGFFDLLEQRPRVR